MKSWLVVLVLVLVAGCEEQPRILPRPRVDVDIKVGPCPCPKPCPRVRPRVVVYSATWCGPCQEAKPKLAQLKARGIEVQEFDIDQVQHPGIKSVPTFFVYIDGKVTRTQRIDEVMALCR